MCFLAFFCIYWGSTKYPLFIYDIEQPSSEKHMLKRIRRDGKGAEKRKCNRRVCS
jgi:hypothetical protein